MDTLTSRLIDDAAMFPPGNADVVTAVRDHRTHRAGWYAPAIGPLVVPDTRLAQVARANTTDAVLELSVVVTGGVGGLAALGRRELGEASGIEIVAAEIALRDLDDLPGNANRVVRAAQELDLDRTTVFVELPYQPGWVPAIEVIEAAGLYGKIRTGGLTSEAHPSPDQLAEQLSALIEADLGFKATAGLHRAWPHVALSETGDELRQHGFLNLMMAIEALVDGADIASATRLLTLTDRGRIVAALQQWDEATSTRVRRRLRSFGCCGVTEPIDDLVELGLLTSPVLAAAGG